MGATQSSSDTAKHGFNVLKVLDGSPAARAKLVEYFDYIISVNGITVNQEMPNVVADMARNHVDRPMKMNVYNSRFDQTRQVTIVPSASWGGEGLMGCSIRFCDYADAVDRIWHVLEVYEKSPAMRAGLAPHKDWIMGSPDIAIGNADDLYNLLIHNKNRPVTIVPDFDWGGQGCLGCDVGTGILHRIPTISSQPTTDPIVVQSRTGENIVFSPTTVIGTPSPASHQSTGHPISTSSVAKEGDPPPLASATDSFATATAAAPRGLHQPRDASSRSNSNGQPARSIPNPSIVNPNSMPPSLFP